MCVHCTLICTRILFFALKTETPPRCIHTRRKGRGGQSEKSDVYIREQSRCEVSHLGINVAEARQRQKQTKRIERREVLDYWCTFTLAVVCCCLGCGGEEGKTTLFYYYDEGNTRSVKICAYATHTHTHTQQLSGQTCKPIAKQFQIPNIYQQHPLVVLQGTIEFIRQVTQLYIYFIERIIRDNFYHTRVNSFLNTFNNAYTHF